MNRSKGIYCVRCKRKTASSNAQMTGTAKHPRLRARCTSCGGEKSQFVRGKGFFSSLGNFAKKVASNPLAQMAAKAGAQYGLNRLSGHSNPIVSGLANIGLNQIGGGRMRRVRRLRASRDGIKRITGGRVRRRRRRGGNIFPPGY